MTLNEFSATIESLTGIDAIHIAQRSNTIATECGSGERENQLFDTLASHGLEEQYADLTDELIPKIEFNPSIASLPYAIRKGLRDAVSLGCAAITEQATGSTSSSLYLEVFRAPVPPALPAASPQFSV